MTIRTPKVASDANLVLIVNAGYLFFGIAATTTAAMHKTHDNQASILKNPVETNKKNMMPSMVIMLYVLSFIMYA